MESRFNSKKKSKGPNARLLRGVSRLNDCIFGPYELQLLNKTQGKIFSQKTRLAPPQPLPSTILSFIFLSRACWYIRLCHSRRREILCRHHPRYRPASARTTPREALVTCLPFNKILFLKHRQDMKPRLKHWMKKREGQPRWLPLLFGYCSRRPVLPCESDFG